MGPTADRRTFLSAGAAGVATLALGAAPEKQAGTKKPVVVAPQHGITTVKKVMERLKAGADPLDAAIEGVGEVEADPNDHRIGRGAIPNAAGAVEMDAVVMHGPTHASGAVAALQNVLHPAAVARVLMQKTANCLIVGTGALAWAKANGFPETDLLTDETRRLYATWKKATEAKRRGETVPEEDARLIGELLGKLSWTGSMSCLALDTHGDLAGLSTSPGSPFKLPGRVGDSPVLGAGLYVDNEVGACCSTGTGELNLLTCGSFQVVEGLRKGMSPRSACLEACKRVAQACARNPRYRGPDGRLAAGVTFYCLAKDGRVGGAGMGRPAQMAVHDGEAARYANLAVFPLNRSGTGGR
jgi:N4-(beta-N-acetylglucosaminyl)-L-asparaginase